MSLNSDLFHQFLVLEPFWLVGAQSLAAVLLVLRVGAFEEIYLRVALEGQDVGRDAVQEPAVVGDDHGAAGEVLDTFLQGADGVYIHIVGGLVEQEDIALVLEGQGQVEAVALTSGEDAAELLLVGSRGSRGCPGG